MRSVCVFTCMSVCLSICTSNIYPARKTSSRLSLESVSEINTYLDVAGVFYVPTPLS